MKRIILLIISVILVAAVFFFREYSDNSDNFRIADSSAVGRIEILGPDSIILVKQGSGWMISGNRPASKVVVDNFLFSFSRIAVKGIVGNPEITGMKGIQIKVFSGRKKYFYRLYSKDNQSFLHKEGSGRIYSVEVSGFPDIKLSDFASTDADFWSERTMVNLVSEDICEVSVVHPSNPGEDFIIKKSGGKTTLYDGKGIPVPDSLVDFEKISFYLSYFSNVFYDSSENDIIPMYSSPEWIVSVRDTSGKTDELEIFPLSAHGGKDMFRALVKYNKQPGFRITRYMVLDLLLQDKQHFLISSEEDRNKGLKF